MKTVAVADRAAEVLFGIQDENLRFLEETLGIRLSIVDDDRRQICRFGWTAAAVGQVAGIGGHARAPGVGHHRQASAQHLRSRSGPLPEAHVYPNTRTSR